MRPRAGISTSEIHLIISKPVSAVRADATEVPMSKHNPVAQTVYPLQGGKLHLNFENQTKISEKNFFQPPLRQEKYAESISEIRF